MAKDSRFATARIASTINAQYIRDEHVTDSFYLDGKLAGKREQRRADLTYDREDRGFFYAVFATADEGIRDGQSEVVKRLSDLTHEVKQGNQNIDSEINDLADCAVEVTGRALLSREGVRQAYFAGVIVKEAEIAAVTTGSGCAYLYRNDILYPLTEGDYALEAIDYNGNPVDHLLDFSAGVAGTIRYSNIAQIQEHDCIILCNREVMEAVGQREMLRLLYEADDQADAAAEIIHYAASKDERSSLQVLIAYTENVAPAEKTGRLNLGLFQPAAGSNQATTKFQPLRDSAASSDSSGKAAEPVPQPVDSKVREDSPYRDYDEVPVSKTEVSNIREDNYSPVQKLSDDDVPAFEPVVSDQPDYPLTQGRSDAFAAGRKYVDEDYQAARDDYAYAKPERGARRRDDAGKPYGEDDYYQDDWQREQTYADHQYREDPYDERYGDQYDEDYDDYDVYDEYDRGNSKIKHIILYVVLVLICIACIYALVRMLLKKGDGGSTGTTTTSVASQQPYVPGGSTPVSVDPKTTESSAPSSTESETTANQTPSNGNASADTMYVAAEGVNVRQAANTDSDVVEVIYLGQAVKILQKDGDWYKISTENNNEGWIRQDLLQVDKP